MAHVEMYTTPTCGSCVRAKRMLMARGVTDLVEIDVSYGRGEMIDRTGRGTVPQILINGQHVGGFDDLVRLDRAGGLDPLLTS